MDKAFISGELQTNVRQIVPLFASRFSEVFAYAKAPFDEWVNTKKLPRVQCTRSITVFGLGYCSCLTGLRDI